MHGWMDFLNEKLSFSQTHKRRLDICCILLLPLFPFTLSFSSPSLNSLRLVRVETLPRLLSLPPLAPAFNMFGQPGRKTPDNKLQNKSIISVPISVCERGQSERFTATFQSVRPGHNRSSVSRAARASQPGVMKYLPKVCLLLA